jgi:YD repeat-containing protein
MRLIVKKLYAPDRMKTFSYAVDSNPMKIRVSEVTGTSTLTTVSTLDIVGSLVSYTDGSGFATERTYDRNNRPTTVTFKRADGTVIGTRGVEYDTANRPWRELIDGTVMSTTTFNTISEPTLVTYGNGTTLTPGRDASGRPTDAWFKTTRRRRDLDQTSRWR